MRVGRRGGAGGLGRVDQWVAFNAAACLWGVLPVVLALTVHDHGTSADPYCVRHCYTLVHVAGPGALGFVGAPIVIGVALFALLWISRGGHGRYVAPAAWSLAVLSCGVCFAALLTSVGLAMLPVGPLTVWAVVTAR